MSVVTTKAELQSIAERMTKAFSDGSAQAAVKARTAGKGMVFGPALLAEIEAWQKDKFAEWGYEPESTLENLHGAVRKFPEMRPQIGVLCDAEEKMLLTVQVQLAQDNGVDLEATAKELVEKAQKEGKGVHAQAGGGHSHGGQPCDGSHGHGGHGHGGGHNHGGGHSHGGHGQQHGGHSHGGVPCNGSHGHGGPGAAGGAPMKQGAMIAQQLAMNLVQKSLPAESKDFISKLQMKVRSGGSPSGDEQLQMMRLQQLSQQKMQYYHPLVVSGIETLEEDQQKALFGVERKLLAQQPPNQADRKLLEEVGDEIATYVAMMGPMLQQAGSTPAIASAQPVAAKANPETPATAPKDNAEKKRD